MSIKNNSWVKLFVLILNSFVDFIFVWVDWNLQILIFVFLCVSFLIQQVDQLKELCTELESQILDMEKLVECKELKLHNLATK